MKTRRRSGNRELVIVGAAGHATSVCDVAVCAGFRVRAFIDATRKGRTLLDYPIVGALSEIGDTRKCLFAVAIGDNFMREKISLEWMRSIPIERFPALIHPAASVSPFARIGYGTVIVQGATVGPNSSIGRFCIINTQASVDHDNQMGDYSSFAPMAVSGGRVTLGKRSAIMLGAVVKHRVSIGDDTVVGANSFVNRDIEANQVAYGNPARVIRSRNAGDAYID